MRLRYYVYVVVYMLILFVLYGFPAHTNELPMITEEGSIRGFMCSEYDCAKLLTSLFETYSSSYCAFYDLNEPTIINAISEYGVTTLVYDHNYDEFVQNISVPVSSKGLMHHKFCVFDNKTVLTGSWNPTTRGTYHNDNVVFVIQSHSVAAAFSQMYLHLQNRSISVKPLRVNLSGTEIELRFCPQHTCEKRLLALLNSSMHSVKGMLFTFTSKPVGNLLVDLATLRNISVEVLFEKTRITRYSQYHTLVQNNISVYNDSNGYTMHHKTLIIDNDTIITGSYNPTAAANTKNDENMFIIKGNLELLELFEKEWKRLVETS